MPKPKFLKISLKKFSMINSLYLEAVSDLLYENKDVLFDDFLNLNEKNKLEKGLTLIQHYSPFFWAVVEPKTGELAGVAYLYNVVGGRLEQPQKPVIKCRIYKNLSKSDMKRHIIGNKSDIKRQIYKNLSKYDIKRQIIDNKYDIKRQILPVEINAQKRLKNSEVLHSAYISLCFKRKYWGRFVSQAQKLFLRYAFGKLGFYKLFAEVYADNLLGQRFAEKSGFVSVGYNVAQTIKNGQFADTMTFVRPQRRAFVFKASRGSGVQPLT